MLLKLLSRWWRKRPRTGVPVIGAMATMPTRLASFRRMLDSILPQLDQLYVFLDGFAEVPEFLSGQAKCRVEHIPAGSALHNASRFLTPSRHGSEAIFLFLDDDLLYPADYVDQIVAGVLRQDCKAIVGFHGSLFMPPHKNYLRHRKVIHFANRLKTDMHVHQLGGGTLAFHSSALKLAPENWPHPRLDDLCLALEAAVADVDLISLKRKAKWLRPISENQSDSIWSAVKKDDRQPTALMREILARRAQPGNSQQASCGPSPSDPAGL